VSADAQVEIPWETGFEDGFCDYARPLGFCLGTGSSTFSVVTSPVHSGRFAAEFTVTSNATDAGAQARCVRQGTFPHSAYYGAWYYVPAAPQNTGNWNLFHFLGTTADGGSSALWDISLVNLPDGGLSPFLYDLFTMTILPEGVQTAIPIAQWFHIEVFFTRAKDNKGELALWQDGKKVADVTGIETDNTDFGQWYVGNLATALEPAVSTVYVDDVSVRAVP
jgi:hypothetical protein